MAYQEEEQLRLKRQSSKQAVDLAMEGRWQEAVEVNRKIVDQFPNDVEAFNRLGRAYLELAIYPEAIAAYTRAKEIDPYNVIAEKICTGWKCSARNAPRPGRLFTVFSLRISWRK